MVYLYEFKIVIHVDDISDAHHEIYDISKEGYCIADSYESAYKIAQKGYPAMILMGGYSIWQKLGFDTIKTSSENID